MKVYFKYANGYVNIDEDNLFLTNSGNWSETHKLLEKSSKSIRKYNFKVFKIYIFLFIIVCLITLILSKSKSGSIPLSIILLGFGVLAYMKREIGNRYKIPISKISNISIVDNSAKILFFNENNSEDFEEIYGIEAKGLAVLENLILQGKGNSF
jgi:hypothetical protein